MSDTQNAASQGLLGIPIGLLVAVLALIGVLLMPLPADLSVAGQRVLAILCLQWWCGSAKRCPTRSARS